MIQTRNAFGEGVGKQGWNRAPSDARPSSSARLPGAPVAPCPAGGPPGHSVPAGLGVGPSPFGRGAARPCQGRCFGQAAGWLVPFSA